MAGTALRLTGLDLSRELAEFFRNGAAILAATKLDHQIRLLELEPDVVAHPVRLRNSDAFGSMFPLSIL